MGIHWGSAFTPTQNFEAAKGRYECWKALKKILPSLKDHSDNTIIYITEQGHYTLGQVSDIDFLELHDKLKEESPTDYLGAWFRLKEAREWFSMEQ
ncbi:MAG: hypothetical protein Q8P58_02650 [Candidatus Adlerbacteria bacterium]|nr:hypothetical protein [Candidatus Adlerbacteria bacterium]